MSARERFLPSFFMAAYISFESISPDLFLSNILKTSLTSALDGIFDFSEEK